MKVSSETLKSMHQSLSGKYKGKLPALPKNPKEDDHRARVQEYIGLVLASKELRMEDEVKRVFRLKQFYEQAENDDKMFEAVNVPG